METKIVEFQYKGNRSYIHGTDMFNAMMDYWDDPLNLGSIRFTIHDVVHSNTCKMYVSDSQEILNNLKGIAVRCQINVNDITYWMAFVSEEDEINLEKRYEYDERQVTDICEMTDKAVFIKMKSPYSFIETIVAMTKYMHLNLFPEATGNWMFTRLDLQTYTEEVEGLSITIRHNMNYRLTKSDIKLDGNKIGDIYFSLVQE